MSNSYGDEGSPRIIALLRMAAEAGQEAVYGRLRRLGHTELRASHLRVLRYPGPHGRRPSELARQVGLSKQALNPLLNDLETWGYLQRQPDPSDQRGSIVMLTPRGRKLLGTIRRLHEELEDDWRGHVGADAFESLLATLAALPVDDPSFVP